MQIKTKKIVITALFSVLIFTGTFFIKVPTPPVGYVNLGDALILLAAIYLPLPYSIIAAAVGASLADFIGGYAVYLPATFIIKAAMSIVVYFLSKKCHYIVGFALAEILMIIGYFIFEAVFIGLGIGAAVSLLPNTVQGTFSIILAITLCTIIKKNSVLNLMFNKFH